MHNAPSFIVDGYPDASGANVPPQALAWPVGASSAAPLHQQAHQSYSFPGQFVVPNAPLEHASFQLFEQGVIPFVPSAQEVWSTQQEPNVGNLNTVLLQHPEQVPVANDSSLPVTLPTLPPVARGPCQEQIGLQLDQAFPVEGLAWPNANLLFAENEFSQRNTSGLGQGADQACSKGHEVTLPEPIAANSMANSSWASVQGDESKSTWSPRIMGKRPLHVAGAGMSSVSPTNPEGNPVKPSPVPVGSSGKATSKSAKKLVKAAHVAPPRGKVNPRKKAGLLRKAKSPWYLPVADCNIQAISGRNESNGSSEPSKDLPRAQLATTSTSTATTTTSATATATVTGGGRGYLGNAGRNAHRPVAFSRSAKKSNGPRSGTRKAPVKLECAIKSEPEAAVLWIKQEDVLRGAEGPRSLREDEMERQSRGDDKSLDDVTQEIPIPSFPSSNEQSTVETVIGNNAPAEPGDDGGTRDAGETRDAGDEDFDIAKVAQELLLKPMTRSLAMDIEMLPEKEIHAPVPASPVMVQDSHIEEITHVAGEPLPFPSFTPASAGKLYDGPDVMNSILQEPIIKLENMLFHPSIGDEKFWAPFELPDLVEAHGEQEMEVLVQDRLASGWDIPLPQAASTTLERYVRYMQLECFDFKCPKDAMSYCSKSSKGQRSRSQPSENGTDGDDSRGLTGAAVASSSRNKEESAVLKRTRTKPGIRLAQSENNDCVLFAVPGMTSTDLQHLNFGYGSSKEFRYLSSAVTEMQDIYVVRSSLDSPISNCSTMRLVETENIVLPPGYTANCLRYGKQYVVGLMVRNRLLCLGPFSTPEAACDRLQHRLLEKCTTAVIKYLETGISDACREDFLRFFRGCLENPEKDLEQLGSRKRLKPTEQGTSNRKDCQRCCVGVKVADGSKRRSRPKQNPKLSSTAKGENHYVLFGSNVDVGTWTEHNDLLRKALPDFLLWQGENDLLSLLRQNVPGMDLPQLYMKVPGVWTGGHEENNRFRSVNINHGPGDCEWWAVDGRYTSRVRLAVLAEEGIDIFATEGQWMPEESWFAEHGIPLLRTRQRKGDVITLKGETLHWVRALGVCVCSSWNYGVIDKNQLLQGWERYRINATLTPPMQNNVPMKTLVIDLAKVCIAIASCDATSEDKARRPTSLLEARNEILVDLVATVLEKIGPARHFAIGADARAGMCGTLGIDLYPRGDLSSAESDLSKAAGVFPNTSHLLTLVPFDVFKTLRTMLDCIISEAAIARERLVEAGYAVSHEASGAMVLHCEAPGCNAELFQNYLCCSTCVEKRRRHGRSANLVLESDECSEIYAAFQKSRRGRNANPKPRPITATESRELNRVSDHIRYMCEKCSWNHYSGRAGEARRGHVLETIEKVPLQSLVGLQYAFSQLVEAARKLSARSS